MIAVTRILSKSPCGELALWKYIDQDLNISSRSGYYMMTESLSVNYGSLEERAYVIRI